MGRRNFSSNLIFVTLISFAQLSAVLNTPLNEKKTLLNMINVCPAIKFANSSYFAKCSDKPYSLTLALTIDSLCLVTF